MKTILFPTDFSNEAAKALPVAAQLARLFNADLHLIHVLQRLMPGYAPRIHDADAQHLDALIVIGAAFDALKATPALNALRVHTHVLTAADPADLLDDPRFAAADLLVMASTGASGLKELLLGSTTEHLIRRATMPLLVLKNPPGYLDLKTIVFASDFAGQYDASIDFLQMLFDAFDYPAVHLLYINTLNHFVPTHELLPRMEAFARRYQLSGCSFNQQDEYDVETGLLAFAHEKQADLIVLGTHGRRGLRHLLQSSVAEDVANHATISVLALPLHQETVLATVQGLLN
ncbi:universal stress protein [Fibrella sp. ES10-3-2-2]|nr:hypothetical protein A6C57_05445 [Fibrella sp. ES10-3-2-2]